MYLIQPNCAFISFVNKVNYEFVIIKGKATNSFWTNIRKVD